MRIKPRDFCHEKQNNQDENDGSDRLENFACPPFFLHDGFWLQHRDIGYVFLADGHFHGYRAG